MPVSRRCLTSASPIGSGLSSRSTATLPAFRETSICWTSLDSPRAWECDDLIPPYIEGFAIRSQPLPAPPEHFFASGLDGMPVWFVAFDELQDVATRNRGTITIKDLKKMGSLRTGVADFYVEEIQTGVNPVSSHRIVTRGKLLDGTSFLAVYSHGSATDVPKIQAIIQFGP